MLYLDLVFIVIFSIFLFWFYGVVQALKSDAPYLPIKKDVLKRLIELAEAKQGELWIDLGSGDGRILIEAVRRYSVQGVGIERVATFRILSRLKILLAGFSKNIKIVKGDFFKADLSRADIITSYLLPETNIKLVGKLKKEAKSGMKFISHRFPIPGLRIVKEDKKYKIFVGVID